MYFMGASSKSRTKSSLCKTKLPKLFKFRLSFPNFNFPTRRGLVFSGIKYKSEKEHWKFCFFKILLLQFYNLDQNNCFFVTCTYYFL